MRRRQGQVDANGSSGAPERYASAESSSRRADGERPERGGRPESQEDREQEPSGHREDPRREPRRPDAEHLRDDRAVEGRPQRIRLRPAWVDGVGEAESCSAVFAKRNPRPLHTGHLVGLSLITTRGQHSFLRRDCRRGASVCSDQATDGLVSFLRKPGDKARGRLSASEPHPLSRPE